MRLRRLRLLALVATFSFVLTAGAAPASQAQDRRVVHVVSATAAQFYGYLTPVVFVEKGGTLGYTNFDIVQHDVVQDVGADGVVNKKKDKWCKSFDKGQCPLFWSPRAGLGDTVDVQGLKNLKSGQIYTFYCTLHPGMKGRLVVR